jgi:methylornithine synthase
MSEPTAPARAGDLGVSDRQDSGKGDRTIVMQRNQRRLKTILGRATDDRLGDGEDLRFLLSLADEEDREALFAAAREVRRRHFGSAVFLYGFVYFSTFCRNDCAFCHYRRSNVALPRYRKSPEEILQAAGTLAASGVHLIDLTMGEWPERPAARPGQPDSLAGLVRRVKARCGGLPVMVSPGVVPDSTLAALAAAGADWYACYQETHNPRRFARLRVGQSYAERMQKKSTAQALGMLIEEGILIGIGERPADVADSIAAMRALDADQVRVMTFVPQEGTPMAASALGPALGEAVVIAVLRLAFPDRLIPASLDVGGLAGLAERLDAGANVVTSLVVPGKGLAGVAHASLDIEEARRTPQAIGPVLARCGLGVADRQAYRHWIDRRRPRALPQAGAR